LPAIRRLDLAQILADLTGGTTGSAMANSAAQSGGPMRGASGPDALR
jgi:hypothetical protein